MGVQGVWLKWVLGVACGCITCAVLGDDSRSPDRFNKKTNGDGEAALLADLEDTIPGAELFGSRSVNSNLLACTLYDFKRRRSGATYRIEPDELGDQLARFMERGKLSSLETVYRSPIKRYASTVMIPSIGADDVPNLFGDENMGGWCWMILYQGQLVHPEGLTFRFRGAADDALIVHVDDQLMLATGQTIEKSKKASKMWVSDVKESGQFFVGPHKAVVGDWITLKPGEPVDLKVAAANVPGGLFSAMLLVEVQGEEYSTNEQGGPILPVFSMGSFPSNLTRPITLGLWEGDASFEGGPVFGSASAKPAVGMELADAGLEGAEVAVDNGMRTWTADNGKTIEARLAKVLGGKVVLMTGAGQQHIVPLSRLSTKDQYYAEIAQDLDFKVSFRLFTDPAPFRSSSAPDLDFKPPRTCAHRFQLTTRQAQVAKKSYDLIGEFSVFVKQEDDELYMLLCREEDSFYARSGQKLKHIFESESMPVPDRNFFAAERNEKDFEYLYVIRTADGMFVEAIVSAPWMNEKLSELLSLTVGDYVDEEGVVAWPYRMESRQR